MIHSLARLAEIASALGVELHDLFRFRARATAKEDALDRLYAITRKTSRWSQT